MEREYDAAGGELPTSEADYKAMRAYATRRWRETPDAPNGQKIGGRAERWWNRELQRLRETEFGRKVEASESEASRQQVVKILNRIIGL